MLGIPNYIDLRMVHQLFSKNLSQCPMPTLLTKAFKVVDDITFDFDELHWTRDDVLNLGNRSEAVERLFPPQLKVVVLEVGVGDLTLGTRLSVPANHVFQLISCKTS